MDRRNQLFLPYVDQVVGKVLILKPIKHHDASFETAAWWEDTVSDTGVFDVKLKLNYLYPSSHPIVYAEIPSTVVDSYFPALYGGVPVGTTQAKYVGERRSYSISKPLYAAILQTGNIPGDQVFCLPQSELWSLCDTDIVNRLTESCNRFAGTYSKWQVEGDGEYASNLSSLKYVGDSVREWGNILEEHRRHVGYRKTMNYPENYNLEAAYQKHLKELAPA